MPNNIVFRDHGDMILRTACITAEWIWGRLYKDTYAIYIDKLATETTSIHKGLSAVPGTVKLIENHQLVESIWYWRLPLPRKRQIQQKVNPWRLNKTFRLQYAMPILAQMMSCRRYDTTPLCKSMMDNCHQIPYTKLRWHFNERMTISIQGDRFEYVIYKPG